MTKPAPDSLTVLRNVVGVMVLGGILWVGVSAWRGVRDVEKNQAARSAAAIPVPVKPAAPPRILPAEDKTIVMRVADGQNVDKGQAQSRRLLEVCGWRHFAWQSVREMFVELATIMDGGKKVKVWQIGAKFGATPLTLDGEWVDFRFSLDGKRMQALKYGERLCNLAASFQWVPVPGL